jgi:HD-like signal output (HDOD) protein
MATFRERLEQVFERVEDLPTLPSVVLELERALRNDETGAEDVARIMAEDPSLTATVLRVANSAFYGSAAGATTSVANAVARLGFREVSRLCTSLAVIRTFEGVGEHLAHRDFWKHSLVAGIATRVLKRCSGEANPFSEDEAYVSGLLHDVGTLVLDQYFPDVFLQIQALAEEKCMPRADAETFILKIDHGGIGALLLERWNLPESIIQAVSWHHGPGDARPEHRVLAQAVHLTEFICTGLGIGDGGDGSTEGFSAGAWHDLSLAVDDIPDIIAQVTEEASRCETLLTLSV